MAEPREGECRDISPGGMFIMTPRPSPRGALIRFECSAGSTEDDFRGTGRVVWQRNKSDPRGPAGMGVRFVRLEVGGREALERVVERALVERQRNRAEAGRRTSSGPPPRVRSADTGAQPFAILATPGEADPQTPGAGAPRPLRRSATLRGIAVQSDAPPAPSEPPRTPLPPAPASAGAREVSSPPSSGSPPAEPRRPALGSPLPPRPSAGGAGPSPAPPASAADGSPLRERLDRTRRGVGSSAPPATVSQSAALRVGSTGDPEKAQPATTSDRPARATVREGTPATTSDRPARATEREGAPATTSDRPARAADSERPPRASSDRPASDRPARPADSDRPPRTGSDRPARDGDAAPRARTSDRPPGPGRTDDLRLNSPLPPGTSEAETASHVAEPRAWAPRHAARRLTPASSQPPLLPDVEGRPKGVVWGLWAIVGTGLLASAVVIKLFSTGPVGLPVLPPDPLPPRTGTPSAAAGPTAPLPQLASPAPNPSPAPSAPMEPVMAPSAAPGPAAEPAPALAAPLARPPTPTKVAPSPKPSPAPPSTKPAKPKLAAAPEQQPAVTAGAPSRPAPSGTPAPPLVPAAALPPAEAHGPTTDRGENATPPAADQTPLQQALDCLSRGDNRCVIRTLEGKASSPHELELLIATYRAMGSLPRAELEMKRYVEAFPNGPRTAEYKRLMERRSPEVSAQPNAETKP
jgi:hypothetical protein